MADPLVLIVEDDDELRMIYRQSLERAGFLVNEANDGSTAIQYLAQTTPDVMILDMMMTTVSGTGVLRYLRSDEKYTNIKLVVITAYPHYRDTALSYNVNQFLTKPVRPSDVVDAVWQALEDEVS